MTGRLMAAAATTYGSTTGLARAVARDLVAQGLRAGPTALPTADSLEGFDAVVLGAPIDAGRPLDPAAFVPPVTGTSSNGRPWPPSQSG